MEEKEIKRGCRMKIKVDKRKNRNTKGRVGKTLLKKKYQRKNRQVKDLSHQKQTNEITPDDQIDLR